MPLLVHRGIQLHSGGAPQEHGKLAAATESEPKVSADLLSVGIFARWRDRIPAAGLLRRGRKGASPGDRIPALRAMLPGVLHPATTQWRITFRFSSAIPPR